MIKVLQILPTTSASRGDLRVVMNYYRNINRDEVAFNFATMLDFADGMDDEIKALGGEIFHFTKPGLLSFEKSVKEIKDIITKSNCDIVHLHAPVLIRVVKRAMRGMNNVKLIVHSHSTKLSKNKLLAIRNKILTIGIKSGNAGRFACSKDAGKALFGKKWGQKKGDHVIFNAINVNKFLYNKNRAKEMKEELNIKPNELAFCHVGRFSVEKNHQRLLDVFSAIKAKRPNSKLFLIGEGPLKEEIIQKAKRDDLNDSVIFLGKRDDVYDCLQAMDVFILPSFFEGLCLSLVEAQAAGLLCFYSDTCVKESMITDNISQISLTKNDNEWADIILTRIDMGWNKNTENSLKNNHYDIVYEARELQKKYEDILYDKS